MSALVISLVSKTCKPHLAVVTFERALSGVSPHVHLEIAFLREGLLAIISILADKERLRKERVFVLNVDPESVLPGKALFTVFTSELSHLLTPPVDSLLGCRTSCGKSASFRI